MKKLHIDGMNIYLRDLRMADITDEYVNWLNSKKVNQFLESRFTRHDLQSTKKYVKNSIENPDLIFFAIIRKEGEKHIGNIKIGPIDRHHKTGPIGLMIGDKKSWGKGFATEAIKAITEYAFNSLNLNKIHAGAYENNIGSIRAFEKAGFFVEGNRKNHCLYKNKAVNIVLLGKLRLK